LTDHRPLPDALLSQLGEFVTARLGLHFPPARWRDLERGLRLAALDFGFDDLEACARWLNSSPLTRRHLETLAGRLTVGETYFFRERGTFEILETRVLPDLIAERRACGERRLRLWIAGCCTGEEPYSLAILLSRLIPDWDDWNVTLLATDINPVFLQKAVEGVYGEWSFRSTPAWVKEGYFRKIAADRYEILPYFRRRVTFAYHNLAGDPYPALLNNTNAMDVILCRNVLMYFAPERTRQVAQNFHRALLDGGWLIVSPSETSQTLFSQFAAVNFTDAILYRKDDHASQPARDALILPPVDAPAASLLPLQLTVPDLSPSPLPQPSAAPVSGEDDGGSDFPASVREAGGGRTEDMFTLYRRGHYTEAAKSALALLAQYPADAPVLGLLARIYANQGRLSEALAWCDRAIAADRLNSAGHYLRATILLESSRPKEALVSLRRTLYLDPDFAMAHYTLGDLTRRHGQERETGKHWQNALALLRDRPPDEPLREAEGLTAGRLVEIIQQQTAFIGKQP